MLNEVKPFKAGKKVLNAAFICAVALTACTTPFKKAKDGSEYKIIRSDKGKKAENGNFLELNAVMKYNDSVLMSSVEDGMPQFGMYDTAAFPSPFKEAFSGTRVGDSVVIRISTDSIFARNQQQQYTKMGEMQPFIKKGGYIYRFFKVINIYTTREQVDSSQKVHIPVAQEKMLQKAEKQIEKTLNENKTQLEADYKLIDDYLAKNNIKATKTKWGTYVTITTEGTGNLISKKDIATVNYTGKTLDSSRVFDSNIDPKFQHVAPYDVQMMALGQPNGVIAGWTDALQQMKKGTKATIYIPSTLAYGKDGREPAIKKNEVLVFDIEVLNVSNEAEMMAKREAEEKMMREQQQKIADSLKNATPNLKAGPKK
jgi:FKBP-type peptidyl-prolyl cis-trans isomerase FkpA